ncbi:hypothetical protein Ctob_013736 [Chrysochromulina tobinii]|uniref:Vacuolar protein sorting 55 n=1 Tax=Chrysochromulina tobinii TaxID=1460289 RepID=A0A0M0JX15_9EUKA|nr:hypothetical protein Ctob_013736 [Chrysochromulina tobinii]|eukprot:KOO30862.1 hypothetical protein Ctob_013736 [Chrysochromulina sp. CCMP291]
MMCSAFVVSLVIFLIVLAGALKNDWIVLVILVPLLLTPLPLLILKCCTRDNWGSTPKGAHWAEFMSGFFFTGTVAIPAILFNTKLVTLQSMLLAISGVMLAFFSVVAMSCIQLRREADAFSAFRS